MKMKRSELKKLIKEEVMKEYSNVAENERIVWAARIIKQARKEPPSDDGYTSYVFNTVDGGTLYWDTMGPDDKFPGYNFDPRTRQTEELEKLLINLQNEYHNTEDIFNRISNRVNKVDKEEDEDEKEFMRPEKEPSMKDLNRIEKGEEEEELFL